MAMAARSGPPTPDKRGFLPVVVPLYGPVGYPSQEGVSRKSVKCCSAAHSRQVPKGAARCASGAKDFRVAAGFKPVPPASCRALGSGRKASHVRPSNPSFRVEWPDVFSSVPLSRDIRPRSEESLCVLPRLQPGIALLCHPERSEGSLLVVQLLARIKVRCAPLFAAAEARDLCAFLASSLDRCASVSGSYPPHDPPQHARPHLEFGWKESE